MKTLQSFLIFLENTTGIIKTREWSFTQRENLNFALFK